MQSNQNIVPNDFRAIEVTINETIRHSIYWQFTLRDVADDRLIWDEGWALTSFATLANAVLLCCSSCSRPTSLRFTLGSRLFSQTIVLTLLATAITPSADALLIELVTQPAVFFPQPFKLGLHLLKLGPGLVAESTSRGIPCVLTAHDYFAVCHRNTLLRPDLMRCTSIAQP